MYTGTCLHGVNRDDNHLMYRSNMGHLELVNKRGGGHRKRLRCTCYIMIYTNMFSIETRQKKEYDNYRKISLKYIENMR